MKLTLRTKILFAVTTSLTILCGAILAVTLTSTYHDSLDGSISAAEGQLEHIDGTISMYIDGALTNTQMMADDPRARFVDQILTNYLDKSKEYPTIELLPDDLVGKELRHFYQLILSSHPSYKDCYIGTNTGAFIIAGDDPLPAGYDPRARPWYAEAVSGNGKPVLSKAYSSTTGEAMVSTGCAVISGGKVLGVTAMDISLGSLTQIINDIKLGETGYVMMVQDDGIIIADPRNNDNNFKAITALNSKGYHVLAQLTSGNAEIMINDTQYMAVVRTSPDLKWKFIALMEMSEIMAPVWSNGIFATSLSFIILLLICLTIWVFINRQISAPLLQITTHLKRVAMGDYTEQIHTNRKDEIGDIYLALRTMTEKITGVVREVTAGSARAASGSRELAGASQTLSQGATEQSASLEEVSASMEEMASNIKANASNATETESIATKASDNAKIGGTAVQETVSAMQEIAEKISIVEEIARQTNLLALNAAIEAARAGEHGKGFAVVAAEVRKLAERSGQAAAEISELSSSSVEVAVKAGDLLKDMVPDIQKTAELIQEISVASNEQNTGAEQINAALQQLDNVVQQNAAASEEMASTSTDLATQAEGLQRTIAYFKVRDAGHHDSQKTVRVTQTPTPQAKPLPQAAANSNPSGVALDMNDEEFERF